MLVVNRLVRSIAGSLMFLAALVPSAFSQPKSATVPLILEGNVALIDIDFVRPDGSIRTGRFIVDSGGGGFLIGDKLAKDIGLKPTGPVTSGEGSHVAQTNAPEARVGGMPLNLKDARVLILVGQDRVEERDNAEGMFPGHVLERYHVIFDYPAQQFTLAEPGSVKSRGVRVESPVRKQNGFVRIEASLGGETMGFLLDTGASYTMVSQTALETWMAKGAAWPKHEGAMGYANMMGGPMEAAALQTRIPELELAGVKIVGAGVVSRPGGTFERNMSRLVGSPIVGSIAGNILRQFRVEIDYAGNATYFEKTGRMTADDMDMVGLRLTPAKGGGLAVAAVSPAAPAEFRSAVQAGDLLRSVDGTPIESLSIMQVVERLRGRPGDEKAIEFERDGKRFTVKTAVTRLL